MRGRGLCRPRLVAALIVLTSTLVIFCLLWRSNHQLPRKETLNTALSQQQIQDAVVSVQPNFSIHICNILQIK